LGYLMVKTTEASFALLRRLAFFYPIK